MKGVGWICGGERTGAGGGTEEKEWARGWCRFVGWEALGALGVGAEPGAGGCLSFLGDETTSRWACGGRNFGKGRWKSVFDPVPEGEAGEEEEEEEDQGVYASAPAYGLA